MEKINIAELLFDCPQGMGLDCMMYQDVYFDYVDELNIIHCYIQHDTHKTSITFNQHGTPNSDIKSKCVIFPKGKTTWEGFQRPFKDGDIITDVKDSNPFIFHYDNGEFFDVHCALINDYLQIYKRKNNWVSNRREFRYATEEEKQKLFDAIKANGYKWNAETKTLEKLPKFKVGDRVRSIFNNFQYDIKEVTDAHYVLVEVEEKFKYTEPIIEDKNWELVPNKFDISKLKPFDKVLVRNTNSELWRISLFGDFSNEEKYFMCMANSAFYQCIPYNEDTKHLLGTNNDCDEYYKTWEK